MIAGARKLASHHLTLRVPWHDDGWRGTVCKDPRGNTTCLIGMKRIAEEKDDDAEAVVAGRSLEVLKEKEFPVCVAERGTFLAPFEIVTTKDHPYVSWSTAHREFRPTQLRQPPFSAFAVPFRWMLSSELADRKDRRGIAGRFQLGWDPEREPVLCDAKGKEHKTNWVQHRENQLVLLDTFFGAIQPKSSLCFFYAKRTPLSEDSRRVIVGVGRVVRVGHSVEYQYQDGPEKSPIRSVLWERSIEHSIRPPDFEDGFVLPYGELFEVGERDPSVRLADCVAFAPNEFFEQFSYGSELLVHDGAIASLLACAQALRNIAKLLPGPWERCLHWIDREVNRLWELRGPFPGLGSALSAFGLKYGTLVAQAISELQTVGKKEWRENPWEAVDAAFANPSLLPQGLGDLIGVSFQRKWQSLPKERRALLELLSRCALREDQATRLFQPTDREDAGINVSDRGLLENPYLLYELDRNTLDPIDFGTVDRGVFPADVVRKRFPVPAPSGMVDAIDARRVRAVIVQTLELAAAEGSSLLPCKWVVSRVRERALSPACPLDEDTLAMHAKFVAELVADAKLADGSAAMQLDRYVSTRKLIQSTVKNRMSAKSKRHAARHDFARLIDEGLRDPLPADPADREVELRARQEKSMALAEVFSSRFSVLIGPAGTGKTTLLRMLCALPEVQQGGLLLLAPTGKARVRLEQQTGKRGSGQTIAQFLRGWERYDIRTGVYRVRPDAAHCADYKTVIVDESSMLTEDQLAATIDALEGVERLILVGDPRQLPPIGAGRPFVDIARELAPADIEVRFPRVAQGYAELTVLRRQEGISRDDLLLAQYFSGRQLDPGADEVWSRIEAGSSPNLRLVQWTTPEELERRLLEELVRELKLARLEDEQGFELSLGGSEYNGQVYFWASRNGAPGAAAKVEAWQILSPVRAQLHGVDSLNRIIQSRFRRRALEMATPPQWWHRRIPPPLGPQKILWGDKIINIRNRTDVWTIPRTEDAYVANGDLGVVVGEFKSKDFNGIPENLLVEMSSQPGVRFKFWASEFRGDEANPSVELAYALTVHKTQGSEFGTTFLVLPNRCWLLSRELLYTALTRHRDRLVLLHQGPPRALLSFSSEKWSELAGRMTNLFRDPAPVRVSLGREERFLEEGLIHRTENGELVRSKSEVVVANALRARSIRYSYERPLMLGGRERYPDFTIEDTDRGLKFYWEHLGMYGDPAYDERWRRKLEEYRNEGILPHEEGGGPEGTLIVTRDVRAAIDSKEIGELIERVLLG